MRLKKIFKSLIETKESPKFNSDIHKECDECAGSGLDFVAGPCIFCDGNGFIDKTKQDKIEAALQHRK